MLGARDRDRLLGAEEIAERGVDQLRRIAEIAPPGSGFVIAGYRCDVAGLIGVVRGQQTVGGEATRRRRSSSGTQEEVNSAQASRPGRRGSAMTGL
ncbi:hypothetical protein [Streptomyces sp. E2N166]|uniref:hypothetical protein n=1 Tax=Streptomyces sp. E2N166 TaxID=1851909 RepID=UPI000EF66126|nr:hypothetical protein [Streptomyces sp. E2N166]